MSSIHRGGKSPDQELLIEDGRVMGLNFEPLGKGERSVTVWNQVLPSLVERGDNCHSIPFQSIPSSWGG